MEKHKWFHCYIREISYETLLVYLSSLYNDETCNQPRGETVGCGYRVCPRFSWMNVGIVRETSSSWM
uniref:Uncharacterized protein n=1 Tax=Physcomitrium patens TaxID=3218 RepID=A0A2K1JMM7_PHYPA|nr:hypothetical protein PHYPA_017624 [Physcomitrium patens]